MPDSNRLSRRASISLPDAPDSPAETERYAPNCVFSRGDYLKGAVFYDMNPIDTAGKNVLFKLSADINRPSTERVVDVVENAGEHLDVGLLTDFNYTLKEQHYQLSGKTLDGFSTAIRDYESVRERVNTTTAFQPTDESVDPRAIAVSRCGDGVFWIEVTLQPGSNPEIEAATAGLVLPNIPFNDTEIRKFFDTDLFKSPPQVYEQHVGAKEVTLQLSDQVLTDVRDLSYDHDTETDSEYIVATNPCYNQASRLTDQVGTDVPDRFLRAISSVERLPFKIDPERTEGDSFQKFTAREITVLRLELSEPLHLFRTVCTPHSE